MSRGVLILPDILATPPKKEEIKGKVLAKGKVVLPFIGKTILVKR